MWRRKSKLQSVNADGIPRNKYPQTFPMHTFCIQGRLNEVEYLISIGVNMNCRDKQGRTPLHEVCCVTEFSNFVKSGTVISLAKKLVANGADPLAIDHMGESPLHCVARHRKNRELASYLVFECKSSLSWLNKYGQTPLDVAKESSYSILNRHERKAEPLSAQCSYFHELPQVFQFLVLNQNTIKSLRELARDKISLYLLPYTNEKMDRLPLPSHIKCYVGGISFIEWLKKEKRL